MSGTAIVLAVPCRMCGKPRHPKEFVGGTQVGYCWHCYEWHGHAMELLAQGGLPRGCQECGRSYDELEKMSLSGDVRFGFHRKDGIYQVLGVACGCSDTYERKRLDMYGQTPYGFAKKLAGAK